ncbi:uncharacterized protein [Musca autumnalis]|uniref:uncharacterized protein n=1 Tax=Musca autumnalis TaxID=221902 RepID=UPI003CF28ACA
MLNIRDTEPTTSGIRWNVYHLHIPLYVLDVIRLFQDHPKYVKGLQETDIVAMLEKEPFACGDIAAQVKTALSELTTTGFVRYVSQKGYRTLGPFARLSQARTKRQQDKAWKHLHDMHKTSLSNLTTLSNLRSCANNV